MLQSPLKRGLPSLYCTIQPPDPCRDERVIISTVTAGGSVVPAPDTLALRNSASNLSDQLSEAHKCS